MNRERTNPSDGKNQPDLNKARNPLDVIRNLARCFQPKVHDQTSPSEMPATRHQEKHHSLQNTYDNAISDIYEGKVKSEISRYQKELEKCESKLKEVLYDLNASRYQLAQWQQQRDKHWTILEQSKQVLDDHKQLLRDPQREREELNKIDATVAPLLKELRDVQKKIASLTKRRDNPRNNIQKVKIELNRAINPFKHAIYTYLSLGYKNDLAQTKMHRHYQLRYEMQNASITSADKVCIQFDKHNSALKEMRAIHENVHEELTWYSPRTTPFAQENSTASLPEQPSVQKITQLRKDVQRIQNLMNVGQWCSDESRVKVQELADNIQQLYNYADAIDKQLNEHYNHLKIFAEGLPQELEKLENFCSKFWHYQSSDYYNPYYTKKRARVEGMGDIDYTLPGTCSIMSTRRGLRKLGIDIHSDATEKKIAQLIEYPVDPENRGDMAI